MKRLLMLLGAAGFGWWAWRLRRPEPQSLAGKVVVITGASAGIGRAASHAFAAEGAKVVMVARRAESLQKLEAELTRYHVPTLVFAGDITDEADLQILVETVIAEFGHIDVLVNNAGVSMGGWFHELDADAIRRMIDVNLFAPLRLTQLALPWMLERRAGHIVNVSGMAGGTYSPGENAHAASKGGLNAWSEALRRELSGTGIDVSVVVPGWTRTEMTDRLTEDMLKEARLLGSLMVYDQPETVARAIIDAVKYRRREVLLGGLGFVGGMVVQRWSPQIMDFIYTYYFDKDKVVEAISKQGRG